MVTRTAALRLQLIDSASGPAKNTTTALKGLEKSFASLGKSGTPEVRKLGKELDYLSRKSRAVGEFRELRRGLKETSREMQAAQADVQRLERAMQSAGKPTRKMEADLRTARSTLKSISAAFREQGAAVRTAENALRSFGLAGRTGIARSQQEIRSQLAQTIKKMRELDREARRPPRGGGTRSAAAEAAVAAGGVTAVHTGRRAAAKGFRDAVDYNQVKAFRDALGGGSTNVSSSTQVGGTRAAGGSVQKGKTYAVGGSGVELFTAGADGFVTPTQSGTGLASSGGIYAPVTIHMTVEGGAGGSQIAEMARVAKQAVEQAFKQLDHELGLSSDTTFANLTYGDR